MIIKIKYNLFCKTKTSRPCIITALTTILIVGLNQFTYAQGWYNTGGTWNYRKAITVNSGQVPSTQTNFPVLVNLASDANLPGHALPNGFDILFTSSDGVTKIPYQRELYTSATGALVAWVNVPSVTTGTVIYMYYGNSGSGDQQASTTVWDANYLGVWHLSQNPGGTAPQMTDATSLSNNGNTSGMTSGNLVTGKVGNGWSFNGSSNYVDMPSANSQASFNFNFNSSFTIAFWSNSTTSSTVQRPVSKLQNSGNFPGYEVDFNSPTGTPNNIRVILENSLSTNLDIRASSSTVSNGSWHYYTITYNGSSSASGVLIYVDGSSLTTTNSSLGTLGTNSIQNTTDLNIGNRANSSPSAFNGTLDETRISNNVRSANWIKTEYNNQSSPSTFYSLGAETLLSPAITGFIPASGCANTIPVVITGTSFTGATAVKFAATDALSFTVNSATQITAIPAAGTTGTISVTTPNGTGTSASSFTVNSLPAASAAKTDISCFNANNGTIIVSGSGGSNTYTGFSISNGLPLPVPNGYQASPTFNGLGPGQYKIRVIDNIGCESKSIQ